MEQRVLASGEVDNTDWGPVADDELDTISLPDAKHSWVKIKRFMTGDVQDAATRAGMAKGVDLSIGGTRAQRRAAGQRGPASQSQEEKRTIHFDTGAYNAVVLEMMIREWSFEKNGNVLPITPRSIGALPVKTRTFLLAEIDARNPTGDEADTEESDPDHEVDQHGMAKGPLGEPTENIY